MVRRILWGCLWFVVILAAVTGSVLLIAQPLLEKKAAPEPVRAGSGPQTGLEYVQQHQVGIGVYAGIASLVGTLSGWLPGTASAKQRSD